MNLFWILSLLTFLWAENTKCKIQNGPSGRHLVITGSNPAPKAIHSPYVRELKNLESKLFAKHPHHSLLRMSVNLHSHHQVSKQIKRLKLALKMDPKKKCSASKKRKNDALKKKMNRILKARRRLAAKKRQRQLIIKLIKTHLAPKLSSIRKDIKRLQIAVRQGKRGHKLSKSQLIQLKKQLARLRAQYRGLKLAIQKLPSRKQSLRQATRPRSPKKSVVAKLKRREARRSRRTIRKAKRVARKAKRKAKRVARKARRKERRKARKARRNTRQAARKAKRAAAKSKRRARKDCRRKCNSLKLSLRRACKRKC